MQKLKKTNTLFHSCKYFNQFKSILKDGGFKASYADEMIENYAAKILMVSFSNVALFESKSQVNYGKFAIGLSKSWGIKNELEPVFYTYENSLTGKSFMENLIITGRLNRDYSKKVEGLDKKLKTLLENSINYLEYLKPYKVFNNKGEEFIAYNDREWRYVYKSDMLNPLIFEKSFLTGKPNPNFEKHKPYNKPYTEKPVLNFNLNDIKFIIVDKPSQKKIIYKILFKKFGKEEVLKEIIKGNLDILARESIWHNL